MAFDRHTIFGGVLVAVILIACIAGLMVTGGPGDARHQKEDRARLQAVSEAALALACYQQANGPIPEDLSQVEAELSRATSPARRRKGCTQALLAKDPVTGEAFRLTRQGDQVTQICADFAAASREEQPYAYYGNSRSVIPDLGEIRSAPGEHCFDVNLHADLD